MSGAPPRRFIEDGSGRRGGRVREAFMAVYGRAPDRVERREAVAFLEGYAGSAEEAVRELLWALMTSAEFLTLP